MYEIRYLFVLTILSFASISIADTNEGCKISKRSKIIESQKNGTAENVQFLEKCLKDNDPVIQRTAARVLIEHFSGNKNKLAAIYKINDPIISRTALQKIFFNFPEESLIFAEDALKNKTELVRTMAISNLVSKKPYNSKTLELIKLASGDKNPKIKRIAVKALWPFHRNKTLLRERSDFDYEVQVKSTIQIPKQQWLFRTDPNEYGHHKNWFAPEANEAKWDTITIQDYWQKSGYDYTGVAWYRKWLDIPQKPAHAAVELHFDGVCESAWIWINGKYLGEHDQGSAGWDRHFAVDITDEIKWQQKNIIAVRVFSSLPHAGGIWKPVRIEILDKASP